MVRAVKRSTRITFGFGAAALALAFAVGAPGCKKRSKGPPFQAQDLAVGAAHGCALMKEGTVRCWGAGAAGQLGDGTKEGHPRPVAVTGFAGAKALYAGAQMTCAVLSEGGRVRCAGALDAKGAVDPSGLADVTQIAIGRAQACAVLAAGAVRCWGEAFPAGPFRGAPEAVPGLDGVGEIAVGGRHACALRKEDGTVRCWGKNEFGQLGDGTTVDRAEPTRIEALPVVVQIAAGDEHTCATLFDRTVRCWGKNASGQLGDGTREPRATPVAVQNLEVVRAVALGDDHSCARLYDGTLRCWGQNDAGQLNDGTREPRSAPIMISGLYDVQQIGLGRGTVCARPADGSVRCWGRNGQGQAGDGSTAERPVPVTVRW